jgi:hypothetical protein
MAEKRRATGTKGTRTRATRKRQTTAVEQPTERRWFGLKPWVVIVGGIVLLILLFAPLFSTTKIVSKTETVMTTVTTQEPETVTRQEKVKVYVGWLKSKEQSGGGQTYIVMVPFSGPYYSSGQDSYEGALGAQQQQQQFYSPSYYPSYYGSQTVTTHNVDASDEIVDVQYVRAPNNRWDVSLIDRTGSELIIRNVYEYDITKTGEITAEVTETQMKTITNQVPQQVTKEVPIQVRVSLVQLIFGRY